MKNIIILNGAPKKNGNTAALIRSFIEGAKEAGNQVTEYYLYDMDIHDCTDCQGCAGKPVGDSHPCVIGDDMQQIYEAWDKADIVVLASPVYWFTVTGVLKNAVDRLYALMRNWPSYRSAKETVFLMTAGAPAEMNPNAVQWYQTFEAALGWKSLGMVLGAGKTDEAGELGAGIK